MGPEPKRRGTGIQPPNRFDRLHSESDLEQCEHDPDFRKPLRVLATELLIDDSKSIVTKNESPDVPFRYSLNPYRGCEHGCVYCYARPTHEMLGYSGGLDFETKILVKERAPELLRDFLAKEQWKPEPIVLSSVTDCYQPAERRFRLTRRCLEVMLEARQPAVIITKNRLILHDLDLLKELAKRNLVHVNISLTTLDSNLAYVMEPRTSSPVARLETIAVLTDAGIPVRVLIAPVIPGLTDSEIPSILRCASEHGARAAGYVLLRLPFSVRPVFLDWLQSRYPDKYQKIVSRIQATRNGHMNDSHFGSRMSGTGELADQIASVFRVFSKKFGSNEPLPTLDCSKFEPPLPTSGQLQLF